MRLLIIRHADPDYPNNTITAEGKLEAAALAEWMHREAPDLLFTSPLGRAKDTMKFTADRLNKAGEILDFTQELSDWRIKVDYGWDGTTCAWDVHGHELRAATPQFTGHDWYARPPYQVPMYRDGFDAMITESDRFLARFGYVREDTGYNVVQSNKLKLVVFCHLGFGLTWMAHLLNIPAPMIWAGFFIAPSSVTTILFDERVKGIATPRCLGFADVSHLYAAGLQPKPRGIQANYY